MIYEICANSYESAKNAEAAGATRIELCSELGVGGITPSYGLIKKVMDELSIGNCVLIRPRSGDFTYSEEEFDVMLRDIVLCRELGCQGVVTGVLLHDNTIDVERTAKLKEAAGTMEFIYHRAFDCTPDPIAAIKTLKKLGVDRILSSGGKKSAIEGLPLLKELQRIGNGKPMIIPGGGINAESIVQIKAAGFSEVHFSGMVLGATGIKLPFSFMTERFLDEEKRGVSDREIIRKIMGNG